MFIKVAKIENIIVFLSAFILLWLLLAACDSVPVPPVIAVTVTATATPRPIDTLAVNEDVAWALTRELLTTTPLPEEAIATETDDTPMPTATLETICTPPEEWIPYEVRTGDTLYWLGINLDVPVDSIKSANCLLSDRLGVAEVLYLPALPPSPPEPGTVIEERRDTPFYLTPAETVAAFPLPIGGPAYDFFDTPCILRLPAPSGPFIHALDVEVPQGFRTYFVACNFPSTSLTAKIEPVGDMPLTQHHPALLEYNPPLRDEWQQRFDDSPAQLLLAFNAGCDLTPGMYSLSIAATDAADIQASVSITVTETIDRNIMVVPDAGTAGADFDLYFCNHDGSNITFNIYQVRFDDEADARCLEVGITAREEALLEADRSACFVPLVTLPLLPVELETVQIRSRFTEPVGIYYIADEEGVTEQWFWIIEGDE